MGEVHSIKNQYRGINAHLHSYLQAEGGWNEFHSRHIVHIADHIQAQLHSLGYTVGVQDSLQIKRIEGGSSYPESDVLVYDTRPTRGTISGSYAVEPSMTLSELLAEDVLSEKPFRSIAISQRQSKTPVAWLELLSPSNKGESKDAQIYRSKRTELLLTGLVFIELDYLHETPPTFRTLPDYHHRESNAHPYRILVLDPRPDAGFVWNLEFDVDQPFPVANIPLSGDDVMIFNFGTPYEHTFKASFHGDQVDYSTLPLNFRHYIPADQRRIAARMLAVLEAYKQGIDLETGPFAVREDITLEQTLAEIEKLKTNI